MPKPWERDWSGAINFDTELPSDSVAPQTASATKPWERDWSVTRSQVGAPLPRENRSEFSRGVSSGADQLQGAMFGLAGLVGDSIGSDELRDWGLEGYEQNQREAAAVGPRIASLSAINDIGDFPDFAAVAIGQSVARLWVSGGTVTAAGL